tara:strand:+ start:636 stop:1577 length:942 start_codon:yes stop_codon:yes gene_type:complete
LLKESKINNHVHKYSDIVIGSRLNAVMYAYLNGYPLLLNKHEPPLPFELFPHNTNLDTFGVDKTEISLVTPGGIEKFGNSKSELWKRLCYSLSLSGLMPLSDNASSMRIEDEILKVFPSSAKMIKFKFSQLHIFDGENVEGLINYSDDVLYQVADWIDVRSGMVHKYDRIEDTSAFVKCIHFYPSERIEGNHNKKDLVAISHLTKQQLNDINYSDTYVRFKARNMMKQLGLRGKRNGKNPNYPHSSARPYKYGPLILENSRREIRIISCGSYENTKSVSFKSHTVEELCNAEVNESYVHNINTKITKQDLLYR